MYSSIYDKDHFKSYKQNKSGEKKSSNFSSVNFKKRLSLKLQPKNYNDNKLKLDLKNYGRTEPLQSDLDKKLIKSKLDQKKQLIIQELIQNKKTLQKQYKQTYIKIQEQQKYIKEIKIQIQIEEKQMKNMKDDLKKAMSENINNIKKQEIENLKYFINNSNLNNLYKSKQTQAQILSDLNTKLQNIQVKIKEIVTQLRNIDQEQKHQI